MRERVGRQEVQWLDSIANSGEEAAFLDISQARRETREKIQAYLSDGDDTPSVLIIATPPGGGKSTAIVGICQESDSRTVVLTPNFAHFSTIADVQGFDPAMWYQWRATTRPQENDPDMAMCVESDRSAVWMRKRWPLKMACDGICGAFQQICSYREQSARPEKIIVADHNYLVAPYSLRKKPKFIVVDENPLRVFEDFISVSPQEIPTHGASGLADVMKELIVLCAGQVAIQGRELMDILAPLMEEFFLAIATAPPPPAPTPESPQAAFVNFINEFSTVIGREWEQYKRGDGDYAGRVVVGGGRVVVKTRKPLSTTLPAKIVVLDGTADMELYKTAFSGLAIYEYRPNVKPKGAIYQIARRDLGKAVLTTMPEVTESTLRIIDEIINRHKYTNAGAVTYKAIAPYVGAIIGDVDRVLTYGGGSSGSNALEDADALFVVGAFRPPLHSVVDRYLCMTDDMRPMVVTTDERGDVRPIFHMSLERYLCWDDTGRQAARVVGGVWGDSPIGRYYDDATRRVMEQAIHRSRYLFRETDVWVISSMPLRVHVDRVFDDAPVSPDGIDLKKWVMIRDGLQSLEDDEFITSDLVASWAGVSPKYALNEKWIDKIASFLSTPTAKVRPIRRRQRGFFWVAR